MSKRAVLEVIALDAEDAVAARSGGADRLELVTDMAADGLTPPRETFAEIRAAVDIPLRVMLRLADGFTVGEPGGPGDVDALVAAARGLRAEGAEEFVFGFLDADGTPDLVTVERLLAELEGCRWTFHRAIDRAADRDALRKQLADLPGLDTYLTAGSATGVDQGLPTLLAEAGAAGRGEPGYGPRMLVGGARLG
ncbi:copper homeostasis protein CutC, partial [Streptomyces lushanensis]|uniref:copper homeostasis protein CutC n=1 Tax=Streptomyces lushanensis TaxID=1434255 RepID=UPI000831CC2B